MNEQAPILKKLKEAKEENLYLLSQLHKSPYLTQRKLSQSLNISLGKTNYLMRQLIKKGAIKARSFSHNPEKLRKVKYILTKKGIQEKMNLTYHFLKKKEVEYNNIRKEWELVSNEKKKD